MNTTALKVPPAPGDDTMRSAAGHAGTVAPEQGWRRSPAATLMKNSFTVKTVPLPLNSCPLARRFHWRLKPMC